MTFSTVYRWCTENTDTIGDRTGLPYSDPACPDKHSRHSPVAASGRLVYNARTGRCELIPPRSPYRNQSLRDDAQQTLRLPCLHLRPSSRVGG